MRVRNSLDAVKSAGRLVDVLRLADELTTEASRDGGLRNIRVLLNAIESEDQITAIAAIHALAHIADEEADVALSALLSSERGFVREHVAWALGTRAPRPEFMGRLIGLVVTGGFAGMVAQRTLEGWAKTAPEVVAVGLEGALMGVTDSAGRYRIVETLGLVHHPVALDPLLRLAAEETEEPLVRAAAAAALGDRQGSDEILTLLERLSRSPGPLAEVSRLALADVADHSIPPGERAVVDNAAGLTVAQLFLHADIDPDLRHAGSGDNGGIATLLVRLGDALIGNPDAGSSIAEAKADRRAPIRRVITLSRGTVGDAAISLATVASDRSGHLFGRIPLLQDAVQSADAWPLRVAARRGIARILRAASPVDVIHLRMADVGSLAAFDVARTSEIPVVFTAAPDPHGLINSMDLSGKLTRENFGTVDEVEHFWFRARLVQRLATNSAHAVFFPRPNLHQVTRDLMGIDIAAEPQRNTTVPEGIDLAVTDESVREARTAAAGGPLSPPIDELRALLEELPVERRGLPVLISVGRLHRVKGMATIVEAWAGSDLRDRTNLVIVGGNLVNPSVDEEEQLRRIGDFIDPRDRLQNGLVLSGHRPNGTVSRWVAAVRTGIPGLIAPSGVYVCGSLKEEFGLALLEAMASGLLVVAPDGGGPATYVEHGRTGFLTTTWNPGILAAAIELALDTASMETTDERATYSRGVVAAGFTIEAMAHILTQVYADVHRDDVHHRQELALTS